MKNGNERTQLLVPLKEVYHIVNNNLQIVSSLIAMVYSTGNAPEESFQFLEHKIKVLAKIQREVLNYPSLSNTIPLKGILMELEVEAGMFYQSQPKQFLFKDLQEIHCSKEAAIDILFFFDTLIHCYYSLNSDDRNQIEITKTVEGHFWKLNLSSSESVLKDSLNAKIAKMLLPFLSDYLTLEKSSDSIIVNFKHFA